MTLSKPRTSELLQLLYLETVFTKLLGWDGTATDLDVEVAGESLRLRAVACRRGIAVYLCPPIRGTFPDRAFRRRIEAAVRRVAPEHLLAFTGADNGRLKWLYARRDRDMPIVSSESDCSGWQDGEALLESLTALGVPIEGGPTGGNGNVQGGAHVTLEMETAARRFCSRLRQEREGLRNALSGITDDDMADWFVSLTINRLLLLRLIQAAGLLDGDTRYLYTRLEAWRSSGHDTHYRGFLCPLFFRVLSVPMSERSPQDRSLFGEVVHLGMRIFEPHAVEQRFGKTIQITDAALERLYCFFDEYTWRLDELPIEGDREINADLLGHILEEHTNPGGSGSSAMGEDVTRHIVQTSLLSHLLDRVHEVYPRTVSVRGSAVAGPAWGLLAANPDRYIWPLLRHGRELPLPPVIQAGLNPRTLNSVVGDGPADMLEARKAWNAPAPLAYGLPRESWRETVKRRLRHEDLRRRLAEGDIRDVDELTSRNLDVAQLCQDLVEDCEDPRLLSVFWGALTTVSVLDPSCGRGTLLCYALGLLATLYEACLDRMAGFLGELERSDVPEPDEARDFREVLAEAAKCPSHRHYALKRILLTNLFGVDISDEEVEICRMRLLIKLLAQIGEDGYGLPLPDLEFQIKTGNTLLGFTSLSEAEEALTLEPAGTYGAQRVMIGVRTGVAEVLNQVQGVGRGGRPNGLFTSGQMLCGRASAEPRMDLQTRLDGLDSRLDSALAHSCGVNTADATAFSQWKASSKPFHWYTAFFAIIQRGGFDVIIANPPRSAAKGADLTTTYGRFKTRDCRNLSGFCLERSLALLGRAGRLAITMPLSLTYSSDYATVRRLLLDQGGYLRVSNFDCSPASLFKGDGQSAVGPHQSQHRVSIVHLHRSPVGESRLEASALTRWRPEDRARLIPELEHTDIRAISSAACFPKVGSETMMSFLTRWQASGVPLGSLLRQRGKHSVTVPRTAGYYVAAYELSLRRTQQMVLQFSRIEDAELAFVLLNSNVFYWLWRVYGDAAHVTRANIEICPVFPCRYDAYRGHAAALREAVPDCIVHRRVRGKRVPYVDFNLRMDVLTQIDRWIIGSVAPDLGLEPIDFVASKSDSFVSLRVPGAGVWPGEYASITDEFVDRFLQEKDG